MKQASSDLPAGRAVAAGGDFLRLKILVLICGAVLMSLEIVGSRMISPYFGNSIYVWGSLISVVMGALSLGYYSGGRLADRHPSTPLLGAIVVAAGLLIVPLKYLSPVVCEGLWRAGLGTRFGALASAVVLFFVPGVLMGMVSPFAVRLAARAVVHVGKTTGTLYALASLGSIAGTLITAFVLIDFLGTSTIVLSLGIVLILTALSCTDMITRKRPATAVVAHESAAAAVAPARKAREDYAPRPRPACLRVIVVACGAILMSLEIAAARIISPYFGHSIYVWGSLISTFLAALTLGYYIGGRLSDKRPSLPLLGSIIAASCVIFLALRYLSPGICEVVSRNMNLGAKLGTLVSSFVLFFPPGVLLGMVSPFVVRLAARAVAHMGKTAGNLYALSTVGSIIGTLVTSFVLIDLIGANATVLLLAVLLILTAVFAADRIPRKGAVSVPVAIACVFVPVSLVARSPQPNGIIREGYEIVYQTDSAYQHIVVTKGAEPNGRPRCVLQFDRYIESAIYLDGIDEDDPDPDAATTYTNVMHLPIIFNPGMKTMLMIGGGGGTLPRQYHKHYGCEVDVAEIDPKVVQISKDWFYLRTGPRLRVHVEDGRMFLKRAKKKYDAILLDAFAGGGHIPFHLTTREFFMEVKEHIAPGGVLAMNVINPLVGKKSRLYQSMLQTWRAVGFRQIYVFPKYYSTPIVRHESRNLILIATMSEKRLSKSEIETAARQLYRQGTARVNNFVMHADHYLPEESRRPLHGVRVLTDDHAPVELMVAE